MFGFLDVGGPVSTFEIEICLDVSRWSCVVVREGYVDRKVIGREIG